MNYNYKAIDPEGQLLEGVIEASSESEVSSQLGSKGWMPIRVWVTAGPRIRWSLPRWNRLRPAALLSVAQQMHSMLAAGVAVDRALGLCAQEEGDARVARLAEGMRRRLLEGSTLSEAMRAEGRFDRLACALVETGERSGDLAGAFGKLEEHMTSQQELRATVVSAMIYPLFLTVVSGASMVFLMTFVVPRFTKVLTDAGRELPLMTRVLLGATGFATHWGWLAALAAIAAVAGIVAYLRGGVPMLAALRMVRGVLANQAMAHVVGATAEGLKEGQNISLPLGAGGWFPRTLIQMMAIGEETGRLEEMLEKAAESCMRDAQRTLKRLMSLLEPMIILIMGLAVGFMVIGILMGIVAISDIPI